MDDLHPEQWERERVADALCGEPALTCPVYLIPCWVCYLLTMLTGTVRSVTEGRFDRFDRDPDGDSPGLFQWAEPDGEDYLDCTIAPCCHHELHGIQPYFDGFTVVYDFGDSDPNYWSTGEAVEVRTSYQYELPWP